MDGAELSGRGRGRISVDAARAAGKDVYLGLTRKDDKTRYRIMAFYINAGCI